MKQQDKSNYLFIHLFINVNWIAFEVISIACNTLTLTFFPIFTTSLKLDIRDMAFSSCSKFHFIASTGSKRCSRSENFSLGNKKKFHSICSGKHDACGTVLLELLAKNLRTSIRLWVGAWWQNPQGVFPQIRPLLFRSNHANSWWHPSSISFWPFNRPVGTFYVLHRDNRSKQPNEPLIAFDAPFSASAYPLLHPDVLLTAWIFSFRKHSS